MHRNATKVTRNTLVKFSVTRWLKSIGNMNVELIETGEANARSHDLIRGGHVRTARTAQIIYSLKMDSFFLLPVPPCRSDDSRTRCLADSFLRPTHKNHKYYLL